MNKNKYDFINYDAAVSSPKYANISGNMYSSDYEDLEQARQKKLGELEKAYDKFEFDKADKIEKELDNLHTQHNQRKIEEYQQGKIDNEKRKPDVEKALTDSLRDKEEKAVAFREAEKALALATSKNYQAENAYQHVMDYPRIADDWINYFKDRERQRRMNNKM